METKRNEKKNESIKNFRMMTNILCLIREDKKKFI